MKKKALSFLKVSLLICTLAVIGLGAMPQPAQADITIYCDGTNNLCATIETRDVIIDVYFGNWFLIIID